MKINFRKFKKTTDNLANKPSARITSLIGLPLGWVLIFFLLFLMENLSNGEILNAPFWIMLFVFTPVTIALIIIFIIVCIFKKLKTKLEIIKFVTSVIAASYIITVIMTIFTLFCWCIKEFLKIWGIIY